VIARNAVAADIPEIVRVINLAYRVEDFFKTGDRTNAEDVRTRMSEPDSLFVVIDGEKGTLAGAVCMEIAHGRGHFGMLSVDPAHQRRGIARALIEAVEARCKAAGCDFVDIEVVNLRDDLPPFYTRLGFTPQGTRPFTPGEELTREAHMIVWSKPIA
jgi:ribosomal protein S18 acetylase RimI-like enzyme